ncbi:hypothetical protein EOD39_1859 [Acipenser ruthenus]|uniref:Uncharacterized protein n=1 Tax=Acipenser ruthenus TaxID=7906 RepID=A0A444U6P0_ACIRT|nr:hypothetical protein EOD39_1859 [Acipenser ruthenus]
MVGYIMIGEVRQLHDDLPEQAEGAVSCAAVSQESSEGTLRQEETEGLELWKEKLAWELRMEIRTGLAPIEIAIVGDCPVVAIEVEGKQLPCKLDTGSQVMFSQAFVKKWLGPRMLEFGVVRPLLSENGSSPFPLCSMKNSRP